MHAKSTKNRASAIVRGSHIEDRLHILAAATGPNPWRWVETPSGSTGFSSYVPTLAALSGAANQYLDRTIWENGLLANTSPVLYVHDGCFANSPKDAESRPYNDPLYGRWQNAEGVLFYLNGVALVSRAKEYYDVPTGFGEAIAPVRANFGMGLKAYFDYEGTHPSVPVDRKKAYFWSEIGDWTARKSYANGVGLMGIESQSGVLAFDADTIAADKSQLAAETAGSGWDYDLRNVNVKAIADFDGDTRNEILLDSTWGIAIIDRAGSRAEDNQRFSMVAGGPTGSQFGSWTYHRDTDASVATGDFDNDTRVEILVTNISGLGMLKYDGTGITSVMTATNGTSFGGWVLNANDNNFFTIKRVKSATQVKKASRILATSSWGMAIFELSGGTLVPITSAQNGTKWGNWTVATSTDIVQGLGDFDGDGNDDILIKSSANLGILSLNSTNSKVSLMVKPNGSLFGGWNYNGSTDVIRKVADLDSDSAHAADILIRNPGWIGILSYSNGNLTSKLVQQQGTVFGTGGWTTSYSDVIEGVGDFTGDRLVDLLVSNRNTHQVGVLTFSNGSMATKAIQHLDGSLLGGWVQTPCMNIVGTGVFTQEGVAKYLVQPRAGDACAPGTVLGDAWDQGAVASTTQHYPRDFSIFVKGNVIGFQDVQGPVGGGSVTSRSLNVNSKWQQPAGAVSGAVSLAQGTVSGDVRCTGSLCSVDSTVTVKGSVIRSASIDFAAVFAKLQGLSAGLKGLPTNGKAWKPYSSVLILTGTDPDLNVFAVDASAFQNVYSIELKVPSSSTAIINVGGAAVAINYGSMNVHVQAPGKILWNLYEATTFENQGMGFWGSVLAPLATVNLQWGSMSGSLVAAGGNVQSEMYFYPFKNNWLVP